MMSSSQYFYALYLSFCRFVWFVIKDDNKNDNIIFNDYNIVFFYNMAISWLSGGATIGAVELQRS